MCGIAGLQLRNPDLYPQLGALVAPMLDVLASRGPDSTGVAVYRHDVRPGELKYSLCAPTPGYDWASYVSALQAAGAGPVANFAKLAAMTMVAWWFLNYFEEVSWVALVAVIVPWVDSYSVWRGPTRTIVTKRPDVFSALSFAFPVPGQTSGAKLGLPDLLFFALFLGASARFQLRPFWTWLSLTASLGTTMALATAFEVGGLPALPLLSVGFLLPNVDLLWPAIRRPRARAR
jgi:hypothetical protein